MCPQSYFTTETSCGWMSVFSRQDRCESWLKWNHSAAEVNASHNLSLLHLQYISAVTCALLSAVLSVRWCIIQPRFVSQPFKMPVLTTPTARHLITVSNYNNIIIIIIIIIIIHYLRGIQEVRRLTQLPQNVYIIFLSVFSIVSCKWNTFGPVFLQSSDSIAEELLIFLFQPSISHAYNISPSKLPSHGGFGPPSNTWFHGPAPVHTPNGISINSAIFAGLKIVTDSPTYRQTDHATPSVTISRIYRMSQTILSWRFAENLSPTAENVLPNFSLNSKLSFNYV